MVAKSEPFSIPVFWSGGLDSSFRVLDLVIHYKSRVLPIYVHDPERLSVPNELAAMQRIRDELQVRWPEAAERLEPLLVIDLDTVPRDPEIARKFNAMRAVEKTSWQYEWLANVPAMLGTGRIEVCAKGAVEPLRSLKLLAKEIRYPGGASTFHIQPWEYANAYEEGFSLYDQFTFPVLMLEKSDEESIAREHGFSDLLQFIWFCHYPWGDQPCGACSVCRYFMLQNRLLKLSRGTRLRRKFWYLVHPPRLLLRHPDRFVQRLRDYAAWYRVKRKGA